MNKSSFRKNCIEKIKSKKSLNRYKLDKMVINILYDYITSHKLNVIMLYIPLNIEVNINPLIKRLRREGKLLLVPFMEGKSFRLVKYRLPLKAKKFGVKEPKNSKRYIDKIDLAIVPIIGTDRSLRRVGFGKGFYDRFFEKNHKKIDKIFFISREYCLSAEVITDEWDVKGDLYLTAKKRYFLKETRN